MSFNDNEKLPPSSALDVFHSTQNAAITIMAPKRWNHRPDSLPELGSMRSRHIEIINQIIDRMSTSQDHGKCL